MRTLFTLALTLAAPSALACGVYMPRPTANTHAIVSTTLPDGTAVTTTERAGELRFVDEGVERLVSTEMWTIRDLDVVDDQLVLAGSSYGQPLLLVGDGAEWEAVPVSGRWMADVVEVEVSPDRKGLVFATVTEWAAGETVETKLGLTRWTSDRHRKS